MKGERLGKKSHRMTDTSKLKDLLQKYNNQGSVLLLRGDNWVYETQWGPEVGHHKYSQLTFDKLL